MVAPQCMYAQQHTCPAATAPGAWDDQVVLAVTNRLFATSVKFAAMAHGELGDVTTTVIGLIEELDSVIADLRHVRVAVPVPPDS